MVKHGPLERRTRAEMAKGKSAAKKVDKRMKRLMAIAKSARDAVQPVEVPENLKPYAQAPIDPHVQLPRSVQAQIDVVNAFYEAGKFHAFVKQLRDVEERLLTIAPTLRLATPGERSALMHTVGGFVQNFAAAMRYMT